MPVRISQTAPQTPEYATRDQVSGRPYARIEDVRVGASLEAGVGLPCIDPGQRRAIEAAGHAAGGVSRDATGLYVRCQRGKHFLLDACVDGWIVGLHRVD